MFRTIIGKGLCLILLCFASLCMSDVGAWGTKVPPIYFITNILVNFLVSTLIDDTLDELSELFNFKQESSYLDSGENKILEDERAKLFNLIQAAKQRIIQEHSR